jgi:hypothetical protein
MNKNPGLAMFLSKLAAGRKRPMPPFAGPPPMPQGAAPPDPNAPPQPFRKGSSGIHIKPSHKGLFTAKAKSAGMGVQGYAAKVLSPNSNASPQTRKQANFARNAKTWRH